MRRSSVKCLEAIISSRRDLLVELYGSVSPTLVSRFKEREENVKTDIFSAYVALLRQTRHPHGPTLDTGAKEEPAISLLKKQVLMFAGLNLHVASGAYLLKTALTCIYRYRQL